MNAACRVQEDTEHGFVLVQQQQLQESCAPTPLFHLNCVGCCALQELTQLQQQQLQLQDSYFHTSLHIPYIS